MATTSHHTIGASEIAVWNWSGAGIRNFGDELGPVLLERLGHRVRRVPDIADAEVITCGSVLEFMQSARPGLVVWGSGLIRGGHCDAERFDVRAVRGRLTAQRLGVTVPLGDPGLLVSALWKRPPVRHQVGVVRHYVDDRVYSWADTVIDVTEPVDDVVTAIGRCAAIVSSSLHGLIVAQSYGIPAVRIHEARLVGGNFKWADYATALTRPVDEIQRELVAALPL
ncbi:polysaccharide pyruvyl transferase family protein [Kitasatospora sp. NPDC101183]|uniref:polysaccharide pyruvyl transferase family protein n=1 Tax=Kitasatospora sp. NPDC101183 TaxID=3364100 RepID=UPI00380F34D1